VFFRSIWNLPFPCRSLLCHISLCIPGVSALSFVRAEFPICGTGLFLAQETAPDMKQMRLTLVAALAALICLGCDQAASKPPESKPAPTISVSSLPTSTIARIHWLGKKQISATTNSAGLMRVWNAPESSRLEAQTLDKLSTAPWRLIPRAATTNTAAAQLLRPLLEDCVQRESYLEIRRATNLPPELAFAIRLPADRAALWQSNLAALSFQQADNSQLSTINHQQAGDWTIVGIGDGQNALLKDFLARIQRDHAPFAKSATNFWLEADVDLRGVADAFKLKWNLSGDVPRILMNVIGDGSDVYTRGVLEFPKSLGLKLEPWNLPTNIIRGSLASFTVMRGFAAWLGGQEFWNGLRVGPPPNQFCVWASQGVPFQTLFTVPEPNASNRVAQLTESLLERPGRWLETNGSGRLEHAKEHDGLSWIGLPFLAPFLRSQEHFILGGFFPNAGAKRPLPDELLQTLNRTNLVYYDWEITKPRIEAWFYIGQTLRVTLRKAQLPGESLSTAWLQAQTNTLGACTTAVFQNSPYQLSFSRRSSVGFTAVELHLLADWLESPQFPRGLNTFADEGAMAGRKLPRRTSPPGP